MRYDVIQTPCLIIDGKLKSAGRVPGYNQIKNWLPEKAA
ncbi:MAG: thioredoxin family protein [Calditrichaeota bacterium]|nr:thioredoxin family protein [Calditrichota bacterium]